MKATRRHLHQTTVSLACGGRGFSGKKCKTGIKQKKPISLRPPLACGAGAWWIFTKLNVCVRGRLWTAVEKVRCDKLFAKHLLSEGEEEARLPPPATVRRSPKSGPVNRQMRSRNANRMSWKVAPAETEPQMKTVGENNETFRLIFPRPAVPLLRTFSTNGRMNRWYPVWLCRCIYFFDLICTPSWNGTELPRVGGFCCCFVLGNKHPNCTGLRW